jgi:hypothetical protein
MSPEPQTVAREARDLRERRDQKFLVRSSENLELRTSNPCSSRLSRATILRAGIIFPKPARSVLRESDAVFPAPESAPH